MPITSIQEAIDQIGRMKGAAEQMAKDAIWNSQRFDAFMAKGQIKLYDQMAARMAGMADISQMTLDAKMGWYLQQTEDAKYMLMESGFYDGVKEYLGSYKDFKEFSSLSLMKGDVANMIPRMPKEYVEFLMRRDYDHFGFLGQEVVNKINDVMMTSILSGQTTAGMLAELKAVIKGEYAWGKGKGLYEWHAGTYARTANSSAGRMYILQQTTDWNREYPNEAITEYMYLGPLDRITRPFCRHIVGGVYSLDDIEQMDNGRTGEPFVMGGGYNCRHSWIPCPPDLKKAIGEYGLTPKKVAEIPPINPTDVAKPATTKADEIKTGMMKEKDFKPFTAEEYLENNAAKIDAWMEKEFGFDIVQMSGLKHPQIANDLIRGLLRARELHPKAFRSLKVFIVFDDDTAMCVRPDWIMKGYEMKFDFTYSNRFKTYEAFLKDMKMNETKGWWIGNTTEDLVQHEIGHGIQFVNKFGKLDKDSYGKAFIQGNNKFSWTGLESDYAMINSKAKGKHFTEGFAEFTAMISKKADTSGITLSCTEEGKVLSWVGEKKIIAALKKRGLIGGW